MNAASTNYREISPGIFARETDQSKVPGGLPPPESRGASQRVAAVATGSLWVDAGEIMKLVRRYEREVELCNASAEEAHKLKLAIACAADGARANALAQASFDLRLLVGGATMRQPTENVK